MLDNGSVKEGLDGGFIKIYSGNPPSSADDAATGTELVLFSNGGDDVTPLGFESPATNGALLKASTETWQGDVQNTDIATYYRHVSAGDDGSSSSTQRRIQGTIAQGGADLNMAKIELVIGETETLDYYSINLPIG